jgi:hypothetical protein
MRTYVFLRKFHTKPRTPEVYISRDDVLGVINRLTATPPLPVHFDLETTGLQPEDPNFLITNIGIASESFLIGLSFMELSIEETAPLWEWLRSCTLSGFNLTFDLAWPWGRDVPFVNIGIDTMIAFRYLATESLKSQPHTLEVAIEEVLGWPEECYQKAWLKEKLKEHGYKKEDMWHLSYLEPEGYTHYCALDAEASFQLEPCFEEIINERGPWDWYEYMYEVIPHKILRIIEGQYWGIPIDREKCLDWIERVTCKALQLESEIISHPEVQEIMEEYTEMRIAEMFELSLKEKREKAKKADKPWLHPDEWRFESNPTGKLAKWTAAYGGYFYKSTTLVAVKGANNPFPRFNFNSPQDMQWLIYEKWMGGEGFEKVLYKDRVVGIKITIDGEDYEVEPTSSGGYPTGGDVLNLFGEIGKKINIYKMLMKMRGDFLYKFYKASERDGAIHPSLLIYGAATGRASGR